MGSKYGSFSIRIATALNKPLTGSHSRHLIDAAATLIFPSSSFHDKTAAVADFDVKTEIDLPSLLLSNGIIENAMDCQASYFPLVGKPSLHTVEMAASMQKQLAQFLRRRRGKLSYPAFARKLGLSSSSLHRMEMGEQNVTLKTLEFLLKRLKCSVTDVFGDSSRTSNSSVGK